MTREIKFRAWNGQFMLGAGYGDWVSFDGVPYTVASRNYDTPNIEIEKASYILMQYTGLKDKNGKDIYEGDLLSHKFYSSPVVVSFVDGQFIAEDVSLHSDSIEVIGNVYENPELLTK